ncbi:protein phosphatase 1 regulatory subunit 12A isoform X2 [Contarinia nasturtii]|uniref:protein phosphatase 1 regulatory subunit 12A isoform X2 n=1 Tax=Contarinia nasturtii TaxID=265458 RepID=UPI0012D4A504|nr:protein phosphatase 1 regulatory subunit 12A isoform X2 [Contarinia nasturtii]
MSFDARNNSAVLKRAEQLKRWEDSDTNRASNTPKDPATRKVKFSSGCVFLAACLSGDKEDIVRLIENGVDIDTANVDGLTALHQACIDDNLEMVEFLVQHGADVNKQDNEGWTPLHATASCGFLSIAQYLIENNADLAAVNSDGDLPIDLSDSDRMHALLEKHLIEQGIDCDEARQSEEKIMLHDAECWLRNDASEADRQHPRTGATALHVAAAKGYNKVLGLLLATRADVDKQDNDGWTPLHAAARWGQKEAAQMLVAALADMDIKNHAGQTPIDVADPSIIKFLEELQKNYKRTAKRRPASQIRLSDNIYNHFNLETPQKVICVEMKSDTKNIDDIPIKPPSEPAPIAKESQLIEDEAPWRRPTSIRLNRSNQHENPPKIQVPEKESPNTLDSEVMLRRTQSFENDEKFYQKYLELRRRINAHSYPVSPATLNTGIIGVNSTYTIAPTTSTTTTTNNFTVQRSASLKDYKPLRINSLPPTAVASTATNNTLTTNTTTTTATTPVAQQQRRSFVPPARDEESETQRKAHAKRVRETRRSTQGVTLEEIKSAEELVKKKNLNNNNNSSSNNNNNNNNNNGNATTPSVASSETARNAAIKTNDDDENVTSVTLVLPNSRTSLTSSSSTSSTSTTTSVTMNVPAVMSSSPSSIANKKTDLDSLTMKASPTKQNIADSSNKMITKISTDVMPSNQMHKDCMYGLGITDDDKNGKAAIQKRSLLDIDNASSLSLADKLRNEANKYSDENAGREHLGTNKDALNLAANEQTDKKTGSPTTPTSPTSLYQPNIVASSTTAAAVATTTTNSHTNERRPSWRLKLDAGCKFKLEDATLPASSTNSIDNNNLMTGQRRTNLTTTNTVSRPLSAPVVSSSTIADNSNDRSKEPSIISTDVTISLKKNRSGEDKENEKENDSRGGQATQAIIQRRRRPKRRSTGVCNVGTEDADNERQDSPVDGDESGSEKISARSRLGSSSSITYEQSPVADNSENGGDVIDYKALYEAARSDNEKLKLQMKKKDDDLMNARAAIDRFTNATTKNTLSELEKREKRAMERKISEMEEELKQLQKFKSENERLRAENRALTRVVSKLTLSAQNQLQNKK